AFARRRRRAQPLRRAPHPPGAGPAEAGAQPRDRPQPASQADRPRSPGGDGMSALLDLARLALDGLRGVEGIDYADARAVDTEQEKIELKNHEVERLSRDRAAGVGVRVLYRGAWGFGARPGHDPAAAAQAARDALAVARAAARIARSPARLAEEEPGRGRWET